MQKIASRSPAAVATTLMEKVGSDRTSALHTAIASVRRGGTLSIIGVYGGAADPVPMMELFDKQIQIRMGQANVKSLDRRHPAARHRRRRPLGTEDFATHRLPLGEAPTHTSCSRRKRTARSRSCWRRRSDLVDFVSTELWAGAVGRPVDPPTALGYERASSTTSPDSIRPRQSPVRHLAALDELAKPLEVVFHLPLVRSEERAHSLLHALGLVLLISTA